MRERPQRANEPRRTRKNSLDTALGKNAYFAEEDLGEVPQDNPGVETREEAFLHTENFFLVDQDGHLRGVYNGMNTASVTQLIADVRTLQQEVVSL